jgi:hypothetical protein
MELGLHYVFHALTAQLSHPQGDMQCVAVVVTMWAHAALTERLAGGQAVLASQRWYQAFAVFFCSVLYIMACHSSWCVTRPIRVSDLAA